MQRCIELIKRSSHNCLSIKTKQFHLSASSSVNLNRLAAFAAVVESGSFTAAAEKLGLSKAMVSQHVGRLEAELGQSLLVRTTRKVTPTEAGIAFHADCARVLRDIEEAVARAGGAS